MQSAAPPALWLAFFGLVACLLALDLGVLHRTPHRLSLKEATAFSVGWIAAAALFGLAVWAWFGPELGLEFATGYLIEKSLSVDNLFVMAVIFGAMGVAPEQQHRVLFWGILGAIFMRLAFIAGGTALLSRFHLAFYVFGALLLVTGIKLIAGKEKPHDPHRSLPVRLVRRVLPVGAGPGFFNTVGGRLHATPLFVALVAVEAADLLFAVDSVPAVLAVSQDTFIVFTSNVFAILGLRALYFLLGGLLDKFRFLKTAVAAILVFVGTKMMLVHVMEIPTLASLGVIAGLLLAAVLASVAWPAPRGELAPPAR